MSQYARLMLHNVSGGCFGNKDTLLTMAKEIESLENTLAEMYSKKMGRTPDEIKAAYFDGKDHYLTAKEALEMGLINGIYDADPIGEDNPTTETIYKTFNNRLQSQKSDSNMNFDEIRKRPHFANCATDDAVIGEIAKLETISAKMPALEAALNEAKTAIQTFEAKAKEAADTARKQLLDAAEADGRINATTRPTYEALLNADAENGEAALAALTPKNRVTNHIHEPTGAEGGAWARRMTEINNSLNK
jgi:ATP-dependent protease ClpP protease subunit